MHAIRSLVGFGSEVIAPSPFSALPAPSHNNAAPKGISGRTSYLRVRLAFHLYPQLIRYVCNRNRFGPPRGFTHASPWPWVAHSVSGLLGATLRDPAIPHALFGLAFAPAPGVTPLASPRLVTRRLILQKARDQPLPCGNWASHRL
jgi:hypothetical protein